jgi:hypothetical protein
VDIRRTTLWTNHGWKSSTNTSTGNRYPLSTS